MALHRPSLRMSLIGEYKLIEVLSFLFEAFGVELVKRLRQGRGSSGARDIGRTSYAPSFSSDTIQKVVSGKAKRQFLEELRMNKKREKGESEKDQETKTGVVIISKNVLIFSYDLVRTVSLLTGILVNVSAPTENDYTVYREECRGMSGLPQNISLDHSRTNLAKRVRMLVKCNIPINLYRMLLYMFDDVCSTSNLLILMLWALRNMSVCDNQEDGIFQVLSKDDINGQEQVNEVCKTSTNDSSKKIKETEVISLTEALKSISTKKGEGQTWREFFDITAGGVFLCQIDNPRTVDATEDYEKERTRREQGIEGFEYDHHGKDNYGEEIVAIYKPYSRHPPTICYEKKTMMMMLNPENIFIPTIEYKYIFREHAISLLSNMRLSDKNTQIIVTIIEQTIGYLIGVDNVELKEMLHNTEDGDGLISLRNPILTAINPTRTMINVTRIVLQYRLESTIPYVLYLCYCILLCSTTNEDNLIYWSSTCLRLLIQYCIQHSVTLPNFLYLDERSILIIVSLVYDIENMEFIEEIMKLLKESLAIQHLINEKTKGIISDKTLQSVIGILTYSIPSNFSKLAEEIIGDMMELY